jgi:hypothetical protein
VAPLVELSELDVQKTLLSARIRMRNVLAVGRSREPLAEQPGPDSQASGHPDHASADPGQS